MSNTDSLTVVPKITIPISNGTSSDTNGVVHIFGQNPTGIGRDHIFSFVFYYNIKSGLKFQETTYFRGLQAYIKMIHDTEHIDSLGMIIYTNTSTIKYLQEFFPLEKNPNLLYAIPEWPLYTTDTGDLDTTVFRTMRYQAVEAFPHTNVHMRDADTLFISVMDNLSTDEFYKLVRDWEDTYLFKFLPKIEALGKQIVLGTHIAYNLAKFHGNLVYPVNFTFPLELNRRGQLFPFTPSKFAYHKNFPYESYGSEFRRKYIYGTDKEDENHAVLAGFSSVLKNREGIQNFWTICVEYMVQRYRMTRDSISNRFHSKSLYAIGKDERMLIYGVIPNLFDKIFFMKINYNDGLPSGFSALIKTREDIEALQKRKNINPENLKRIEMLTPSYFNTVPLDVDPSNKNTLPGMFYTQVQRYQDWLTYMKEKYPTETDFLNSINANLSKALTPDEYIKFFENLGHTQYVEYLKNSYAANNGRRNFAKFNKAGRKATVRRGGAPRRKLVSKTKKQVKRK
jgi:hypothetical protein